MECRADDYAGDDAVRWQQVHNFILHSTCQPGGLQMALTVLLVSSVFHDAPMSKTLHFNIVMSEILSLLPALRLLQWRCS